MKKAIFVILLLTSLNLYGEDRIETGDDVFFIEENQVYRQQGEEITVLGYGSDLYLTEDGEYLIWYLDIFINTELYGLKHNEWDSSLYLFNTNTETRNAIPHIKVPFSGVEFFESPDRNFLTIKQDQSCSESFNIIDLASKDRLFSGNYINDIYWLDENRLIYTKPEPAPYPSPFRPMVDHNDDIYSISIMTIHEDAITEETIIPWTRRYYPILIREEDGKFIVLTSFFYKLPIPNILQKEDDGQEINMPYFWYASELDPEDFTLMPLDFNEQQLVHQTRDVLARNTLYTRTIGQVFPGMVLDILDVDTESQPPEPGACWIQIRTESGMEGWCSSLALLSDDWKR